MSTYRYNIYGDAAEVIAEVTPETEPYGSPWYVHLYDMGDGLLLNEVPAVVEAASALEAASEVAHDWMVSQGLPPSFSIRSTN